jgi:hypothetical protein
VPTFAFSTDRATDLAVDVLVLPVFEGPEAGPGVKDVKGVDLLGQFSATGAKGKEWKGDYDIVTDDGAFWKAARSVANEKAGTIE